MKVWVLRIRAVDSWVYFAIKREQKTVETRAPGTAKKNYGAIEKNDVLFFICGKFRLKKKVKKVQKFKSIKAMLDKIPKKKIWPNLKNPTLKEIENIYYGYPGYRERIKKNGIIAIWI